MTLLEVGRIVRAHGVRGEVLVDLVTNRHERLAPGSILVTAGGPIEVATSRPHKGRWIVAFAGVADRARAERLRGTVLMAEPLEDPEELWVHELIGAEVVDRHGIARGRCVEVRSGVAADVLVLESGALVPASFVSALEGRRILVEAPEGLFDL